MLIKNKKILIILSVLFVITETFLSYFIHKGPNDIVPQIKHATVVIACLFMLFFAERSWEYVLTQTALIMTVSADYFLIVLPEIEQFTAMVFFSIVQICYFTRLFISAESKTERIAHIIIRIELSAFAIVLTNIVLRHLTDAVSLISMFYFANLIVNIVFAMKQFKSNYLLAIGLVCFSCCDALIGFSFLGDYIEIAPGSLIYKLANPGYNYAWMFYVPSQMLLALSLLPKRVKTKEI